jgi:glutamate-5-semialdehyde dehydrogenase
MSDVASTVQKIGQQAKMAALKLAAISSDIKNKALHQMSDDLEDQEDQIIAENEKDMAQARIDGLSSAMLDRLKLDTKRIASMAKGIRDVAALPDPTGEIIKEWNRPNGLQIQKVRVPLGVVGIIYESRPNVTADSACLCVKVGDACILRGGSESLHTNMAIAKVMSSAGEKAGLPEHTIQLISITDRAVVREMARLDKYLSCIVPRGGEALIRAVTENATVPVIKHYHGVCHVYVDKDASLKMAENIVINAKCQRPGVCNAMETLLIHRDVAPKFLPQITKALAENKVELRLDEVANSILRNSDMKNEHSAYLRSATEQDWTTEYLDLILSIRVVDSIDAAIHHINHYGSAHSDSIVTKDKKTAKKFLTEVDSATVYHNASTRFTDGAEFGMGAEIGISTDRLHARGPMALEELTTYKYLIHGDGQIRE